MKALLTDYLIMEISICCSPISNFNLNFYNYVYEYKYTYIADITNMAFTLESTKIQTYKHVSVQLHRAVCVFICAVGRQENKVKMSKKDGE